MITISEIFTSPGIFNMTEDKMTSPQCVYTTQNVDLAKPVGKSRMNFDTVIVTGQEAESRQTSSLLWDRHRDG